MEITDDIVKKKHKEFNERVAAAINRTKGSTEGSEFPPGIHKLKQLARLRKPPMPKIGG